MHITNRKEETMASEKLPQSELLQYVYKAADMGVEGIAAVLEDVPPEIASDVYDFGLMLSGGCAHMPGLADAIRKATGLRVTMARNPRDCVINGLGRLIQHPEMWGGALEYRLK